MNEELAQMLGRIDGKLDQVIDSFKEHREDDTRRFESVHKTLNEHRDDINQAKGAKSVLMWMAGGIAAAAGATSAAIAKALGWH